MNADQYNGRIVKIANSFVFKEPVFNYSGDFPFLWEEITVPVKYGGDYRLARDILQRVLVEITCTYSKEAMISWAALIQQYGVDSTEVAPRIFLIANDNWMEFTLRYIVDYKKRRIARRSKPMTWRSAIQGIAFPAGFMNGKGWKNSVHDQWSCRRKRSSGVVLGRLP